MDVPEAAMTLRVDNVLALVNGKAFAFGAEARDGPEVAAARSHRSVQLLPIYDPRDFSPIWTSAFLGYCAEAVSTRLRRGLLHTLLDRVDWDLHLPGYEAVPVERRRRFEELLALFTFTRSYSINGEYRRLPPFLFRRY